MDFSSEEGKGSTFWVTLPSCEIAAAETTESIGSESSVADEVKGHGEVVLLVDTDGEERKMLSSYLEHCGFKVITATTGLEVMKALRVEGLRVAVIQNDLPELPGEDVVSVIRSNPVAANVPIVLLSAKAFVFDVERFLKMGVERCLAKPVELKEVALTVSRLIA